MYRELRLLWHTHSGLPWLGTILGKSCTLPLFTSLIFLHQGRLGLNKALPLNQYVINQPEAALLNACFLPTSPQPTLYCKISALACSHDTVAPSHPPYPQHINQPKFHTVKSTRNCAPPPLLNPLPTGTHYHPPSRACLISLSSVVFHMACAQNSWSIHGAETHTPMHLLRNQSCGRKSESYPPENWSKGSTPILISKIPVGRWCAKTKCQMMSNTNRNMVLEMGHVELARHLRGDTCSRFAVVDCWLPNKICCCLRGI